MIKLVRIAPEFPVSDLKGSLAYYEQKLGFQSVMEMPQGDYAIVEREEIAIHLFRNNPTSSTPVAIHIFTEDLETLHAELTQRGADITQPILRKSWGNRDFRVKDEFGNELKFTEPLSQ
ncbi:bleomycin resistance protein [Acidicapsa dinghuensis]|uniref:Bleomycin resistance protein n=1 Tax=Acidicapsa dinghuensis TaxID=2218256 RepID=A0ABW1EIV4_9BACT|nr:VOC family protein [Acidicapsa dinghuensis]